MPSGNKSSNNGEEMFQRPRRFELVAHTTHGSIQNDAVESTFQVLTENDQKRNGTTKRLRVEKRRQIRRSVAFTEGIKERYTVINDRIDIRYMSHKTFGKAMPLVINSANGKTVFRDVDSCKLDEPTRLAGEAMDDADNTDDRFSLGKWDPPLGKELKAARVGNKL